MDESTPGFSSSTLGTKEHWDNVYSREVDNFISNGDVGEVWFGYGTMRRVMDWLDQCPDVTTQSHIIDLGCGNGVFSVEMTKRGYEHCVGIDYSEGAIELARKVADAAGCSTRFEVCDILNDCSEENVMNGQVYDVCVDKGTFDAVSLCPEEPDIKRRRFVTAVRRLLRARGLLLVTSCNWTAGELTSHFTHNKDFEFLERIKSPTFTFGGVTGNRETSLVFRRTAPTN